MAKITIDDITSSFASVTQLNAYFQQLEDELNDKVLYRNNPDGEPNTMENDLDMNSNDLLNGGEGSFTTFFINGTQVTASQVVDAPDATQVSVTPAGDIASTNAQAALEELDSEKQPVDPTLTALAGLSTSADDMIYATASDTFSTVTSTSFGRGLLSETDASSTRTTLDVYSTTETDNAITAAIVPPTLSKDYIAGIVPSVAADALHDITLSAGECRDSADTEDLVLTSPITKQIDAAWAAGDNAGGMFTGTVAASTTYHMFLIRKDSDGSIDAGFDTSISAANIPTGYTAYRRVFSFLTDGSADIPGFSALNSNTGLVVVLDDLAGDYSDTSPGTSEVLVSLSVPSDIQVLAHIKGYARDSASFIVSVTSVSQTNVGANTTNGDLSHTTGSGVTADSTANMDRVTNTSGQIRLRSDRASGFTVLKLTLMGWTDWRIA